MVQMLAGPGGVAVGNKANGGGVVRGIDAGNKANGVSDVVGVGAGNKTNGGIGAGVVLNSNGQEQREAL